MPFLLPHRRLYALLLVASYLFFFFIPYASAEEPPSSASLVQSLDWWIDKSGQADLVAVQNATDWTPFSGWKNFGFGKEPIWIRVRVMSGKGDPVIPWVAMVRPSFLDNVRLYDPEAGLAWQAGDAFPMDDDMMGSITYTFRVPNLNKPRDLYLRLESTSARAINIDVLPLSEAKHRVRHHEWLFGFAVAMSFIFVLWAVAQWWLTHEKVIGIFVVKQLFATLWAFFTLGFARVVFDNVAPPGVISAINNTLLAGVLISVLWFMKTLFREYRPRPFWMGAMSALIVLAPAPLLLQLWGLHWQSVALLNAMIPLVIVVIFTCLATAKGATIKPAIPRGWLLLYLCLYVVLNAIPPLTYLGALPENPAVDFGNLAYLLMDGFVMLALLQVRAAALGKRQLALEKELVVSEEQTRLERQYREDQGHLLAMLAHEVKTPLATMRMWIDTGPFKRDAMERVIADMNQVIERCVHAGQLSDKGLQPNMQRLNASQLTHSVIQACRVPERVDLNVPDEEILLTSDPHMLSIVLANLLDNACKYSPCQDRITLNFFAAQSDEGVSGWCWEIRNPVGPSGVPDADKLFDKYYRGKNARRQSGSGLGLFLVKNLLTLMKGSITYLPQEGEVVFRIWLPA